MGNFMGYSSATELFTAIGAKIKAKYSKPSGGIPKSDLSSIVQASLEKADSALQSETDPTVPTWAKQLNKPSYTQDEVPDGSTYKRVSSTEKSAWNGKQNALTTTQMQAVNSGITSEKVGQISTNQTNILYVSDHIGKNYYNIKNENSVFANTDTVTIQSGTKSVTATVNADGSVTLTGATEGTTPTFILESGDLSRYAGMYLSGAYSDKVFMQIEQKGAPYDLYAKDTGSGGQIASIPDLANFFIRLGSNFTIPGSITLKPMICSQEQYNISPAYQPYSVPNSDLTYLEAEDRAELIELVDSGAKNKLQNKATSGTIKGVTFTVNSDGSISTYGTSNAGNCIFYINQSFKFESGVRYVLTGCPSGGSSDGYRLCNIGTSYIDDFGYGGEVTGDGGTREIAIYIQNSGTNMGTAQSPKKFYPMITTKAAFGVSQKFVPYQVPITGAMSVVDKEIVCSSTLTTTGIKFTSTEKAAYRITATAIYYNSIPMKLAIKHKISPSMSQGTLCTAVHVENEDVSLTVSGIRLLDVGGEFEIFAQYASSTNNRFYVLVEKIG